MTATETSPQASLLPTEKTPPRKGMDGKTLLLFGPYKVGKSTLAAHLSESPLFLATEPGQDALDIYRQPINSWQDFLDVGKALVNGGDKWPFDRLVVDTVDELARLCAEHVLAGMAKSEGFAKDVFVHASDFEYGKGWDAVAQEFRLRVAKLCNLGLGVVFISHEKESTVKTRTGLEITKLAPDVGSKGMRKWLLGFCDLIIHADIISTTEGEQRVLQLQPTENVETGGRFPAGADIPPMIPLSAPDLLATLKKAWA